jgi:2-polyprenyl-6-methoxyphenol hydroxylase-like FAD-dependent oxidoreductase
VAAPSEGRYRFAAGPRRLSGAERIAGRRDRGSAWQIGLAFPKGGYQELRQSGVEALRRRISRLAPWLADRVEGLQEWTQTPLLVVSAGRVRRWYRPGLLLIGDAAHVMSPVFGVGINYAVQDAVVAANALGPRLQHGEVRVRDLAAVQRRREWPTRLMQLLQSNGEHMALSGPAPLDARLAAWLMQLKPFRPLHARLVAFGGLRPERVDART